MTPAHGTDNRYTNGPDEHGRSGEGCRCKRCTSAHTTRAKQYRTRQAQVQWGAVAPVTVDAEPVRAHVRVLMAAGLGRRRIAALAGVAPTTLTHLLYGNTGSAPAARLAPETARKLLAVSVTDQPAAGQKVDATGTRRRLQALTATGWNGADLARRLGKNPSTFHRLFSASTVTAATARAVTTLYARLWDQPPPERTRREKAAATQSRNYAREHGWLPPAAWDDELIDLPDDQLAEEIARQVAAMDEAELRRCKDARYKLGEQSPLIVAAAKEHDRRYRARKTAERAA